MAHAAPDELTKDYNWPAESAADESFTWPPAPVQHKVDPTPRKPLEKPWTFVLEEAQNLRVRASDLTKQGFRLTDVYVPPKFSPDT